MSNLKNKNILFVGSFPPPLHGQSIAFQKAFDNIECNKKYLVAQNFEGLPFRTKIIKTIFSIFKIIYCLSLKKIDLIYFTCSRSKFGSIKDIFLLILAGLYRKKIITHLHGADFKAFYDSLPDWYKKIVHNSYKKIDTFIILHEKLKEDILSIIPGIGIEVVHNFYDDMLDKNEFKKEKSEEINLLYLSNIMKSKGIIELLDAFKILEKKYDSINLSIAGDFISDDLSSAAEIKKLFYEKINSGKITYHGVINGKEKAKLLFASDIFILPTYYKTEAFPISILEAMRAENAIITTKHNILPYIVNKANGRIIKPKSSRAIVESISELIEDRNKMYEIQQFNVDYAKKNYSMKAYIDNLTKITEKTINEI